MPNGKTLIQDPEINEIDKINYDRRLVKFLGDERYKELNDKEKKEKLNMFFDKVTNSFLKKQGVEDVEDYRDSFITKYIKTEGEKKEDITEYQEEKEKEEKKEDTWDISPEDGDFNKRYAEYYKKAQQMSEDTDLRMATEKELKKLVHQRKAKEKYIPGTEIPVEDFEMEKDPEVDDPITYILSQGYNTSTIGLLDNILSGKARFDLENYESSMVEEAIAFAVSMTMDLPLFIATGGVGGLAMKGAARGALRGASIIERKLLQKGVQKTVARKFVERGVEKFAQSVGSSAAGLGFYSAEHEALNQMVGLEDGIRKDFSEIDWDVVKKEGYIGAALGGALGALGYGGASLSRFATRGMQRGLTRFATKGGLGVAEFAGENAIFLYGGKFLHGDEARITGEDWLRSVSMLGALKGSAMIRKGLGKFMKSQQFKEPNKGAFKIELTELEKEMIGEKGRKTEDIISTLDKNRERFEEVLKSENVPIDTKEKLTWSLRGVIPELRQKVERVDVDEIEGRSFLSLYNKKGDLISRREYDGIDKAEANAREITEMIIERQMGDKIFALKPDEKAEIFKRLEVEEGLNQKKLEKAINVAPQYRTKAEKAQVKLFFKTVNEYLKEKEPEKPEELPEKEKPKEEVIEKPKEEKVEPEEKPEEVPEKPKVKPEEKELKLGKKEKAPEEMTIEELSKQEGNWFKGKQHLIPQEKFKELGIKRNFREREGEYYNILAEGEIGDKVPKETIDKMRNESIESHKRYIEKAIKEGKEPYKGWEEDYPELKKEYEKELPKTPERKGIVPEKGKPEEKKPEKKVPEEEKKVTDEEVRKRISELKEQREAEYNKVEKIKDPEERIEKSREVEEKFKKEIDEEIKKQEGDIYVTDKRGAEIRVKAKGEIRKGKREEGEEAELEPAKNVFTLKTKKIKADPERFQQREDAYSKESVKRIIEDYDPREFDPIVVWKDPKTNETIALAGHSRLEAMRRMKKEKLPGRFFEGTEKEAIEYAKRSNVLGTPETLIGRANLYRDLRKEGVSETEIKKRAKDEGKNAERVIDYSFLNSNGKIVEALKRFEKTGEGENTENLRNVAQFIGRARRTWNKLTDKHEDEMTEFLLEEKNWQKYHRMSDFLNMIREDAPNKPGGMYFDPEKPLNLSKIAERTYEEMVYKNKLKEYENNLKEAKKDWNEKKKELDQRHQEQQRRLSANENLEPGEVELTMEKRSEILKPYEERVNKAEKELLEFKQAEGKFKEASKQTRTLWSDMGDFENRLKKTKNSKELSKIKKEAEEKGFMRQWLERKKEIDKQEAQKDKQAAKINKEGRVEPSVKEYTKPKKIRKILSDLAKGLKHKIRFGPVVRGGRGEFSFQSMLFKIKEANDLDAAIHETGHLLDAMFNLRKALTLKAQIELDKFDATKKPPKGHPNPELYEIREGIAEWVRAFAFNPDKAKKMAPEMYRIYEEIVSPEVKNVIGVFSDDVRTWWSANPFEKIGAQVASSKKERNFWKKVTEPFIKEEMFSFDWVDNFTADWLNPWRGVEKSFITALKRKGVDIANLKPSEDVQTLIWLMSGYDDTFHRIYETGMIDSEYNILKDAKGNAKNWNWLLKPAKEATDGKKSSVKEFVDFVGNTMIAKRTLELINEKLPKRQIIKDIKDGLLPSDKVIDIFIDEIGDVKIDKKTTVRDAIENLKELNPERLEDKRYDFQDRDVTGIGAGIMTDHYAAGRAVDKYTDLKYTDEIKYNAAEEMMKRYRELSDDVLKYMRDAGRISEELYGEIKATNSEYVALKRLMETGVDEPLVMFKSDKSGRIGVVSEPLHKIKGSARTIIDPYEALLENIYKQIKESNRNRAMQAFVNPLIPKGGEELIDYADIGFRSKKGEPNTITVFRNGEPEYWRFDPDVYKSLKGLRDLGYKVPWIFTLYAKTLRVAVTRSPQFAARNRIRDFQHRLIFSDGKFSFKDFGKRKKARQEFEYAGGGQFGYYLRNKESYYNLQKRAIKDISKSDKNFIIDPKNAQKINPMKIWEKFGSLERATRLEEYNSAKKYAKKKLGYSEFDAKLYAAKRARNLLDFKIIGYKMRLVNQVLPFANARVQGFRKMILEAQRNPGKFTARWITRAIIPQLLNTAGIALFSTDEQKEEYKQFPHWRRDLFYNIPIGNIWITLPKPFELGVMASAVGRVVDNWVLNDDDAYKDGYVGWLMLNMSPADPNITTMGHAQNPLIEMMSNYDSFRKKNIIPAYEKETAVELRKYKESASRLAKLITKIPGLKKMDPRMADFFIKSQFSYFGDMATQISDIGREGVPGIDISITGLFRKSSLYGEKNIQWLIKTAKENKRTYQKDYKLFLKMLSSYFEEKDDKKRNKIEKQLRNYAKVVRSEWEEKGYDKPQVRKKELEEKAKKEATEKKRGRH